MSSSDCSCPFVQLKRRSGQRVRYWLPGALTPPEGITFGGKLGLMLGVIVTPDSDVWVVGITKSQLVHFPNGDLTKGKIICEGRDVEPSGFG